MLNLVPKEIGHHRQRIRTKNKQRQRYIMNHDISKDYDVSTLQQMFSGWVCFLSVSGLFSLQVFI